MIARVALRLGRDLLLIPLSAFLIYQAVRVLPLPSPDIKSGNAESLPAVVRMKAELGVGRGLAGFTVPWRILWDGDRLGEDPLRYDARDIGRALAGSLRIGGMALGLALALACAFALARASRLPGAIDQALDVVPTLIYGTPSFLLALLVASFTGMATDGTRGEYEVIAAAVVSVSPGIFLGVLLTDALRLERDKAYMTAARARGRSRIGALVVHALPNALPTLLDALPPVATALLAGSFVAEKLFHVTYFGYVYVEWASSMQLAPVVVATTLFVALLILVSLAAELLRWAIDPRQRGADAAGAGA